MKALAALSEFLGIHKQFKDPRESYGLDWSKGDSDKLIIDRNSFIHIRPAGSGKNTRKKKVYGSWKTRHRLL